MPMTHAEAMALLLLYIIAPCAIVVGVYCVREILENRDKQ